MVNEQTFFAESPERIFERAFERIRIERMAALPICRTDIAIRALGFTRFAGHWLGALVTPWSVLVIFASGNPRTWPIVQIGKIMPVKLPSGAFHFLGMQAPFVGPFLACSLMSPIEPIYRQKEVEMFALDALRLMMKPAQEHKEKQSSGDLSMMKRRNFFAPTS